MVAAVRSHLALVVLTVLCLVGFNLPVAGSAQASSTGQPLAASGSWVLTATDPGAADYAPTFTGNGFLGVRVPPDGQGYAAGSVPAQSEVAGFYAQPSGGSPSQDVQQRANIPTWSTLGFSDGTDSFSLSTGTISGWEQQLDLRTGVITTTARWQAPDGHVTDLRYEVFTDRARPDVGLVRLTFTPQWSGQVTVSDTIDGTPATMSTGVARGWDPAARETWETVQAVGTGVTAGLSTRLTTSVPATITQVAPPDLQSVGQQASFAVRPEQSYVVTKYVGVATSTGMGSTVADPSGTPPPTATAQAQAADAERTGFDALQRENAAAWSRLWSGRIDVLGDPTLATQVNASEFYLWSSTRAGSSWSVSPAGLSSNGYDGHIFWDAETWMYPSLLAQHPEVAVGMDDYRYQRLSAAEQHASATGYSGARFPWESALDGTEQIPPPTSVNSEGLYEQHITADIALAQWQYYLATGDRTWLEDKGWPVLSQTATFWASRATRVVGGYVIRHVTGPDEENPDVSDEAYTQVAAATTLRDAIAAARRTGHAAPRAWARIAAGLERMVPVRAGVNPEFAGYRGQLVKQADVTLLAYPWGFRSSPAVERNDLSYYVPRTDPGGPSMDDALSMIESAQLTPRSCQAFVYTERSFQPYIRDVFHQFSETRTGGAFTFMTGIGGFLQEFLYGYSGMRWNGSAVRLVPGLSGPITSVTLRDLHWHGRTFTLAIHRDHATVTLERGAPMPVRSRAGRRLVHAGRPLTIGSLPARRPASADALRCGDARASSSLPGAPPLAAVDGSSATDWQPGAVPATLTAPTRAAARTVSQVTIRWGRMWPAVVTPNVHPEPGPVHTLRARRYAVDLRTGGRWHQVARVDSRSGRTLDVVRFPAMRASEVRIRLLSGTGVRTVKTKTTPSTPVLPMVQELVAS